MLQNYDVEITDFIKLTNAGLKTADFVQIKAAIIKRYKDVYGQDIDVSTASADGIFVNDLALIINNILKTMSTMYANLDVNSATGAYLDILCRLSNIKRKGESFSTANVRLTNNSGTTVTIPARVELYDKAGQIWVGSNELEFELPSTSPDNSISLNVVCQTIGQVIAEPGYIYGFVDASINVDVEQSLPANVGGNAETDDDLRERRAQSNGAVGLTVLESLYGVLRDISTIEDVKIYNNPYSIPTSQSLDNSIKPKDGTDVNAHSIYVIIREKNNTATSEEIIGSTIYNKLTPGISTSRTAVEAQAKSYDFSPTIIGSEVQLFTQSIYWKQARGIKPAITLTLTKTAYFDINIANPGSGDTFEIIAKSLINYLNSLPIGRTADKFNIQLTSINADPTFKGAATFVIDNVSDIAENPDEYYDYTTFVVAAVSGQLNKYTITLR